MHFSSPFSLIIFKDDWNSDKRPESDGNQQYFTSLPVILHDMIEENIKVKFAFVNALSSQSLKRVQCNL